MSQLDDLFTRFGTDKNIWGYVPAYETHLGPMRNTATRVLEIGICGFRDIPGNVVGASLFAWRDYFPLADVYGLDNDSRFIFNDHDRIHTALCDAYNSEQLAKVIAGWRCANFDFICDDAVHDPLPQINLALMLLPVLKPGGVYAIEEACNYKCPDNDIRHLVRPIIAAFPDLRVTEYQTHKDERLLILRKPA